MNFLFSEDQKSFQESIGSFLAKECTPDSIRALWETETARSPEMWAKLAEMGVLGMLVPEEHGGLSLSELELVLPLEETGRVALPEPVVETAAIAVPLLRDCSDTALAAEWLPKIAAGQAVATVGLAINPVVTDAHIADLVLLQHGGEIHALVRDAVTPTPQPATDRSRRLFTLAWTPSEETCIARGDEAVELLAAALDRAALATAAQLVGIAQQLVDIAVEYAKERQQFGVPIGSFQAVKHHLSTVQVAIEFARAPVARAADSVARGLPTRATDVSQAKIMAGEAAARAARTALQVHGGIGYTWEVHLHIWMKRAWALDAAWGSREFHRGRIGRMLFCDLPRLPSFGFDAEV